MAKAKTAFETSEHIISIADFMEAFRGSPSVQTMVRLADRAHTERALGEAAAGQHFTMTIIDDTATGGQKRLQLTIFADTEINGDLNDFYENRVCVTRDRPVAILQAVFTGHGSLKFDRAEFLGEDLMGFTNGPEVLMLKLAAHSNANKPLSAVDATIRTSVNLTSPGVPMPPRQHFFS